MKTTKKNYQMFNRHEVLSSLEFKFLFRTNSRIQSIVENWQDEDFMHPVTNQLNGLYDGYYYFDAIKNLQELKEDVQYRVKMNNDLADVHPEFNKVYFPEIGRVITDAISIYKAIWERIAEQEVDEMEIHARNLM